MSETTEGQTEIVEASTVAINTPVHISAFIKSLNGTANAIYGKLLSARFGKRAFPRAQWDQNLADIAAESLPVTNHGHSVGRSRGR
jgi:hypothetical protein